MVQSEENEENNIFTVIPSDIISKYVVASEISDIFQSSISVKIFGSLSFVFFCTFDRKSFKVERTLLH